MTGGGATTDGGAARAARGAPGARRLIVNADDFGFTPAVTAGILEAHTSGIVTSTSMMVHCPGWDDALVHARATPSLGFGLHFNLLVGAPITAAPSLRDMRGNFLPLGALVRKALTNKLSAFEISCECEAQLAALVGSGIPVTHIDSHRHTHALPVIRRAVSRIAAARGIPLRRPIESHRRFPNDVKSQLHRAAVAWSWRATSIGAARTRAPDHFIGVSMQGVSQFAAHLSRAIDTLPQGATEMMVHPGYVDDVLTAIDAYTWQRVPEREALTAPDLRERVRRAGISLINFTEL